MVTSLCQGDVFWIDCGPIQGSAPADVHPCVIVQSDLFNMSKIGTTVVCLITSNLARGSAPGNVLLRKGEAHLPKASVVNISQILTVNKSELQHRIGRLTPSRMAQVIDGLHLIFAKPAYDRKQ